MKISILMPAVLLLLSACSAIEENAGGKGTEQEYRSRAVPYLIFSGNCREAMNFYADCLGGQIVAMTTFAESNLDLPEEYNRRIFNSELKARGIRIMASDDMPGSEVAAGDNFAVFLIFPVKDEVERVFGKLSAGGEVLFPLDGRFGMLEDRFGVRWMLEAGGQRAPQDDL